MLLQFNTTFIIIGTIVGAVPTTVAVVFAVRKLYQLVRPIRLEPNYRIVCNKSVPDEINVTIINNRSSEPQYIVSCGARGIHSLRHIAMSHLRKPFLHPRLYHNVRFGAVYYNLLKNDKLKIEPYEPVNLQCKMYDHPLNAMFTPFFLIEAKLSSGRIIRSKKIRVPQRWRLLS